MYIGDQGSHKTYQGSIQRRTRGNVGLLLDGVGDCYIEHVKIWGAKCLPLLVRMAFRSPKYEHAIQRCLDKLEK